MPEENPTAPVSPDKPDADSGTTPATSGSRRARFKSPLRSPRGSLSRPTKPYPDVPLFPLTAVRAALRVVDLPLEAGDVLVDALEHLGRGAPGGVAVILLAGEHADELPAAVAQLAELADFRGRQGPDHGGDDLAEVGQDAGVDAVRLGQLPGPLGEAAGLAGVDDDGGQAGGEQGADGGLLVRAGRFKDDAAGRQGLRPGDELLDAGGYSGPRKLDHRLS